MKIVDEGVKRFRRRLGSVLSSGHINNQILENIIDELHYSLDKSDWDEEKLIYTLPILVQYYSRLVSLERPDLGKGVLKLKNMILEVSSKLDMEYLVRIYEYVHHTQNDIVNSIAFNMSAYLIFRKYESPEDILSLDDMQQDALMFILTEGNAPRTLVLFIASILTKEKEYEDYEPVVHSWSLFVDEV